MHHIPALGGLCLCMGSSALLVASSAPPPHPTSFAYRIFVFRPGSPQTPDVLLPQPPECQEQDMVPASSPFRLLTMSSIVLLGIDFALTRQIPEDLNIPVRGVFLWWESWILSVSGCFLVLFLLFCFVFWYFFSLRCSFALKNASQVYDLSVY